MKATILLAVVLTGCAGGVLVPDDEGSEAFTDDVVCDTCEPLDCPTEPDFGLGVEGPCTSPQPTGTVSTLSMATIVARTGTANIPAGGNRCANGLTLVWAYEEGPVTPEPSVFFYYYYDSSEHIVSQQTFGPGLDSGDCDPLVYWAGPVIPPEDCDRLPFDIPEYCLDPATFVYKFCKNFDFEAVYPAP